jgi:hypothetical protein
MGVPPAKLHEKPVEANKSGNRANRRRVFSTLSLEFGHFQAAAPHGWGMLQLAKRA